MENVSEMETTSKVDASKMDVDPLRMADVIPAVKQSKIWPCHLCPQTFHWRRHLDKHVEGHSNNDCRMCNAKLATRKLFVEHMFDVHNTVVKEEKYECIFCREKFVKKLILFNHYKKIHACGLEVCMICGVFLETAEEENIHKMKHEKERPWKCSKCEESFSRRQQYLVHMEYHTRHVCGICDFNFSTKLKLMTHNQKVHPNLHLNPTHKCSICSKTFARPNRLILHQRTHTGEEPAYCQICKKNFRSQTVLNRHMKSSVHAPTSVVDDSKNIFNCDNCSKSFAKKSSLVKHLLIPHSYKCEFCTFSSKSRENTKRHIALHTESRQFVCEQCGQAFFTLIALTDHCKYVHSNERLFPCQQCSQAFKTNSALTRHLQSHSDHRPHVCHCGLSYKRQSHLRRHQDSSHGPTLRHSKKLQRLGKDESGNLVPIVEDSKSKSKQAKKAEQKKDDTEMESNSWPSNLVLMVGNSGQVVTIQQMCDIPQDLGGDSYESLQVAYNMDFTTPTTSAADQQLVFTTLEPSQQLLANILQEDGASKHSEHIYISEERVGTLTSVMLDANGDHAPMQACMGNSNPMLASPDDLLFSCGDSNNAIAEYQTHESSFLNMSDIKRPCECFP